jgi:hypothetical protein
MPSLLAAAWGGVFLPLPRSVREGERREKGPYFLPRNQRTIVTLTSISLNGVCAGAGYAQRVDLLRWSCIGCARSSKLVCNDRLARSRAISGGGASGALRSRASVIKARVKG